MGNRLSGIKGIIWAGVMLVLILDSKTAWQGCEAGISLCIQNVIPSLLPFMVVAPVFAGELSRKKLRWLHPLWNRLKLPPGGSGLLITGCLSGYPVGAQCITAAQQRKQISPADATRLMGFCCNCGPGFIFGICGGFFASKLDALMLWLIHIASAMLVGLMLPGSPASQDAITQDTPTKITTSLAKAVRSMAQVCGWVVIFRCLLEFAEKWALRWLCPELSLIISGALELTNGCCRLPEVDSQALRFILCEAMLCFGGICVYMQTKSLAKDMGMYLPGKALQTAFAVLISVAYTALQANQWGLAVVCLAMGSLGYYLIRRFLGSQKKIGRNLIPQGV